MINHYVMYAALFLSFVLSITLRNLKRGTDSELIVWIITMFLYGIAIGMALAGVQ